MEAGPTTVRPSEPLDALIGRMQKRRTSSIIVSTANGVLVGVLRREGRAAAVRAKRLSLGQRAISPAANQPEQEPQDDLVEELWPLHLREMGRVRDDRQPGARDTAARVRPPGGRP